MDLGNENRAQVFWTIYQQLQIMENEITLTIARVLQKINNFECLIVDIFTQKEYRMEAVGKQRMYFINLELEQEIYIKYSTLSALGYSY